VIHGGAAWRNSQDAVADARFAKRLEGETIRVLLAYAFPGPNSTGRAKQHAPVTIDGMAETGHELPNLIYPGHLDSVELMKVERFLRGLHFRPRVAWRIVRKTVLIGPE
jgi:hypothetical protein